MKVIFELLIKRRPLSVQARADRLQDWISDVHRWAKKQWNHSGPHQGPAFALTIVFLYDSDPIDVDNIVKPIQDALCGVVYEDDVLVTDIDSHRRKLSDSFDLTNLPRGLIKAVKNEKECV